MWKKSRKMVLLKGEKRKYLLPKTIANYLIIKAFSN